MGEVYRARDSRLNREVAIKVLLPAVANDPERLARFQREAQVLASLNHPNIAHIHGLEDSAGERALVMELVDGPTLAERIASGPIAVDEALSIAKQIAEALEAAHERGIVHRDLKPANVKVRPDGVVKVLDFGLAKVVDSNGATDAGHALENSPTVTAVAVTGAGVLLGTAAYMSPEQVRALPAGKRSDIWAFGCVLYEMLTARRAFAGETISDAIAAILSREPDWTLLPPSTPDAIRKLLRRCLEKDRRRRLADAADVRLEIEDAQAPASTDSIVDDGGRSRRAASVAAVVTLAVVVFIAAVLVWTMVYSGEPRPAAVARYAIVPSASQPLGISGTVRDLALSREGTHIVYTGPRGELFVRALDQLEPTQLAGISGARAPFLSPDGRWIGFFTGVSGELRKVPIGGGPPLSICRFTGSPRGASWSEDGLIVFATNEPVTGLLRVSAEGGEPEVLTSTDMATKDDHLFPAVLPGGRAVLFTIANGISSTASATQVAVFDVTTRQVKHLVQAASQAEYTDTGHLVYASGGALRAVRFDLGTLETVGDPGTVLEHVLTMETGAANFVVSKYGALIYAPPVAQVGREGRSLVWVSRQGAETGIPAPPRTYRYPSISPDGKRVVVSIDDQEYDLWIWDLARHALTRLTFDQGRDVYPAWTPDQRRVVFMSGRVGVFNLYARLADGTGSDERLTTNPNAQFGSPTLSRDGSRVVFAQVFPDTSEDLMMLTVADWSKSFNGAAQPETLLRSKFAERNPQISPDGRWLAFESNESGREEVYVRPFPNVAGGQWQVSTGGGTVPVWSRTGRELFYRGGSSLMAAAVGTDDTFSAGAPTKLFDGYLTGLGRSYDVSPDGQRFLMIKEGKTDRAQPASFVVVEHWFEELNRLVPAR
jgi:eukaryotic-like serine/threonine-protein kinase